LPAVCIITTRSYLGASWFALLAIFLASSSKCQFKFELAQATATLLVVALDIIMPLGIMYTHACALCKVAW
jgi:hypothetical protein